MRGQLLWAFLLKRLLKCLLQSRLPCRLLCRLLEEPPRAQVRSELVLTLRFDPVCAMVISPRRARARLEHGGITYYFCSANCRDCFEHDPAHYLRNAALAFAGARHGHGRTAG